MKQIISAAGLTPDDFTRSGCDTALAASPRRWDSDYLMALHRRMEEAQKAGDGPVVAVCRLLYAVMASRAPWNPQPPPAEDDPLLTIYELDESGFAYLHQTLGQIADDEVRARAADLLYQDSRAGKRKPDIAAAAIAVRGYLAESVRRENIDRHWCDAEDRIERAFGIAAELNHRELRKEIVANIERAIVVYSADNTSLEPPSRYPAQLMKLLLRYGEGDAAGCAPLAERLAQEALAGKQWEMHREYLEIAADWYARCKDPVRELAALDSAAESWVEEGRQMVERPDTPASHFLLAEHRLLCGIQALRAVKGRARERGRAEEEARLTERIEEVRWLHLQYQERGVTALPMISSSVESDLTPVYAAVEGRDKMAALFAMADFALPTRADIEAMVREEREKYLLSRYFGQVQLEERGRTTARAGSGTEDADLWARMSQTAVRLYQIRAQYHVGPLIWRVGQDHAVDLKDFGFLAHVSPFVPEGRTMQFARGLHAGMQGNFPLALHLLIPQIEHALREIVRAACLQDEGLRSEYGKMLTDPEVPFLGQALCESPYKDELERLLGEDTVFALRVLLIERFGGNLRNRVLHGLSGYDGLQGWLSWYLWWLVLKICCAMARTAAASIQVGNDERKGESNPE